MTRIEPVRRDAVDEKTALVFDAVKAKMGMVPNLVATMAHSSAVMKSYLEFSGALSQGVLSGRLREQISLVVGEKNHCAYCVSAHAMGGVAAGMTEQEVENARLGHAEDAKEHAALVFALAMVQERGHVSDDDLGALRDVGFSEGEIVEIMANVSLNMFTNYFNHVAATEIDFPLAPELNSATGELRTP